MHKCRHSCQLAHTLIVYRFTMDRNVKGSYGLNCQWGLVRAAGLSI